MHTGDLGAPTTELGVLSHEDDYEDEEGGGGLEGARLGAAPGAPRFTLSDEEERPSGGGTGRPQPRLNLEAQQAGVVVEQLPTPVTPAPMALPPPPR